MAINRKEEIVKLLKQNGNAKVADLSKLFGVTEETIRRDLDRLEADGVILRTHGGAVLVPKEKGFEPPVLQRESIHLEQKEAIGKYAASLVEEGEIIALDASTTCLQLVKHLPDRPLTVLTYSLAVVNELIKKKEISVILIGGNFDSDSMAITGMSAENMVEAYHVDKFFFSCQGFDDQRGVSEPYEAHARLKEKILNISDQHILVADSSKFGKKSLIRLLGLEDVDLLITDTKMANSDVQLLKDKGINIVRTS
ncbi:DeoR/GlpR family DNA-binding transcription regulator [Paenibacillus sp. alder61]|uniref:DeoR/GlpR family DNA-binding transcription regulator n=1 Tax=Paenibacillus sp. alder61 TaxID=2862948 RepID=UPI001CD19BF5|nr:DeoR/GlpR family DNA-binding transcription regulator [Paenibacillus sp. alder61]MCA1292764.1 DeoR/GlpR family DNA-binding transcription regulator [Paenibacillus sp. alder61]